MFDKLIFGQDGFVNDDIAFRNQNFAELNEDNEFSSVATYDDLSDVEPLDDNDFYELLKDLGSYEDDIFKVATTEGIIPISIEEERKKFEMEKALEYEKIHLEWTELEKEKVKFAKEREEFLQMKTLSEENFRIEKKNFDKEKQIEKKKMNLETQGLIDSCYAFIRTIEEYRKDHDVSE